MRLVLLASVLAGCIAASDEPNVDVTSSTDEDLTASTEDSLVARGELKRGCGPRLGDADLAVSYVSRLPRFPKSIVEYEPPSYNPRLSAASAAAPQWPNVGDRVTFEAHVVNQGDTRTAAVRYAWSIDGQVRARGVLHPLAPGASQDLRFDWNRQDGDHEVRFALLDAKGAPLRDRHSVNNAREQRTNAIMFTIYTWPGFERWMAEHDNGVGTRSAADWVQFEADEMNRLFRLSTSDLAPEGVKLRIAIDRIVQVPEETP